jgi:hypothetical protein
MSASDTASSASAAAAPAKDYPVCSAKVTDSCIQKGAARHRRHHR